MNCDSYAKAIPLYFYGELPSEEEERLEDHLDACEACRGELERYRVTAGMLDQAEAPVPAGLLAECRHDLMRAVYRDEAPAQRTGHVGAWHQFRQSLAALVLPFDRYRQPIGAVALLSLGFVAAHVTMPSPVTAPVAQSGTPEVIYSAVRSVQPDRSGGVQIALDETRRRVISGRLDDGNIQKLLLAAARDENNPGVRVESMDLLKNQSASTEIRGALLDAVVHDANPGVRLKALEGLKPFSSSPEVRRTLAQVLLRDENAGVRVQAIDKLIEHADTSIVGLLQNVVEREDNNYVRLRCQRALKQLNASVGTF